MFGIDDEKVKDLVDKLDRVATKLDCAIDATEIRGMIVTLNQTAANLLSISETLKKLADKFN
ncbi:MAG: hypothetical protein U1E51_06695 [Candidatus Binatia bacterium]|nr:hypothetical protein [Candidatus Binatia bacterium]